MAGIIITSRVIVHRLGVLPRNGDRVLAAEEVALDRPDIAAALPARAARLRVRRQLIGVRLRPGTAGAGTWAEGVPVAVEGTWVEEAIRVVAEATRAGAEIQAGRAAEGRNCIVCLLQFLLVSRRL